MKKFRLVLFCILGVALTSASHPAHAAPAQIEVWGWGANSLGQLGDGTVSSRSTPVIASGTSAAVQVAAGSYHGLATTASGSIFAWGSNSNGQIGDGTTTDRNLAVTVPGLSNVVRVAAGGFQSFAIAGDGGLWAWGSNSNGELGIGSTTDAHTPQRLPYPSGVTAVAGGQHHALAVDADGGLWAWGFNAYGQLGDGTNTDQTRPVPVSLPGRVRSIAAGVYHSLALLDDGTVWAWGYNAYGQLGNGTTSLSPGPARVPSLSGIVAIAAGSFHSMALASDGTVWTWGLNSDGQLGDGTTTSSAIAVHLPGLDHVAAIAGGGSHSLALADDGTVWSWGANTYGQLGDTTTTPHHSPAQVYGQTGVTSIATGFNHSVAVAPAPDYLTLALAPANGSIVAGGSVTFHAEGHTADGKDLGDKTAHTSFSISPDGVCSSNMCTATKTGPHTVTGTDGVATGTASVTVVPGPATRIAVSPSSSTVKAGVTVSYAARAYDQYGNDAGDVTGSSSFSMTPDGACDGAACTATKSGEHTVTADNHGLRATASQTVTGAAPDHLALTPASSSIQAGMSQSYAAEAFDVYGNDLGSVTGSATFGIAPDGWCSGSECGATVSGSHGVTATWSGASGTASLAVTPAPLDHLTLSPASSSIVAGSARTYAAEGFDVYGNDRGDVTAQTTFSIAPDGSCTGPTCGATKAGAHTVTGVSGRANGSASLQVAVGAPSRLAITPKSSTIVAGASVTYAARAYDPFDNDLGDKTAQTTFAIAPDGACNASTCAATKKGAHSVTAAYQGLSDSATMTVNASTIDHLTLSPSPGTTTAGSTVVYAAEGFDVYGNDLGDVTTGSTFTMSPDGSCARQSCRTTIAGAHTVRAALGNATGRADLDVQPGPVDHMTLSVQPGSIVANGAQTATARLAVYDEFDNPRTADRPSIRTSGDASVPSSMPADGAGGYAVTVRASTTADNEYLTAQDAGVSTTALLHEDPGPPASITVSADPSAVQPLPIPQTSTVTAVVRDAFGNTVPGVAVTFDVATNASGNGQPAPLGPAVTPATATTGDAGSAAATYTPGRSAGDDVVRATVETSSGHASASTTIRVMGPASDCVMAGTSAPVESCTFTFLGQHLWMLGSDTDGNSFTMNIYRVVAGHKQILLTCSSRPVCTATSIVAATANGETLTCEGIGLKHAYLACGNLI